MACKILQTEAYNINEVARRVGFGNMSAFIKNFKKITGTPKAMGDEYEVKRRRERYVGRTCAKKVNKLLRWLLKDYFLCRKS